MPPLRLLVHHLIMEEDDPEKLIAEMERRLADAHPVGDPRTSHETTVSGGLTSDDVRNVAFSKPSIGKRGYNEDEVDAFLDRVEAAQQDTTGRKLTPEDVRNVAFSKPPIGKRGYNEDEVDAFLEMLLTHVTARPGAFPTPPQDAVAPPPARRLRSKHERPQSRYRRITDDVLSILERMRDNSDDGTPPTY
jgi:DivIVA domain-containing protein